MKRPWKAVAPPGSLIQGLRESIGERIRSRRMLLAVGSALGLAFLVLTARRTSTELLAANFAGWRWDLVPAMAGLAAASLVLRTIRWRIILTPVARPGAGALSSMVWIGTMAIALFPARSGEVVRPIHLNLRSGVSLVDAAAAVVVERLLDTLSLAALFVIILATIPVPPWMRSSALAAVGMGTVAVLVLALGLVLARHRRIPTPRAVERVRQSFRRYRGDRAVVQRWLLLAVLSALQWVPGILLVWVVAAAFHLALPLLSAAVVMIILLVGISLPAPPAYIGNYQYFAILGLGLVGVSGGIGVSFAIALYVVQMAVIFAGGLAFLALESMDGPRTWLYGNTAHRASAVKQSS